MFDALEPLVADARRRTFAIASGLAPGELLGPRLDVVNPPLWELGHVAWFQERWVLRHAAGHAPLHAGADALYDSSAVPHDARWTLPLPGLDDTLAYLAAVRDRTLDRIAEGRAVDRYFVLLSVLHEDMHAEAMAYTRQTLGLRAPPLASAAPPGGGPLAGDVEVAGGAYLVGAPADQPFAFDNERSAHEVELAPFRIARAPVTQAELRAFVEDDGYARRELWADAGWRWREAARADHPAYWRRDRGGWLRRDFDAWVPLEPHRPAVNVCAWEAEAFCRWAGRRLPTEAEWEVAAATGQYPWGDAPARGRAHLDCAALACADVAAYPDGDGPRGCRQMLGNVWEWTASAFEPYPGFEPGPYRDYSAPWFGTHRVLRGGSFATTSRLAHARFRNFYTPDRRDVWAGFRTCAP